MTDWLPWGACLTLTTLGALLAHTRGRDPDADRRLARRIVLGGGAVTLVVYALYLLVGERWLWY